MEDTQKPAAETAQTSATLPIAVLQALRGVSSLTGITQSQIITEALLADARIAMEMDLRQRAAEDK